MRLLNTKSLKFSEFFDSNVPRYVILSHRWGDREVTLQAFREQRIKSDSVNQFRTCFQQLQHREPSLWKIIGACQVAESRSFEWIWIDVCCVDKSSSVELSEAMNSMFRWYAEAAECYAYLKDVEEGSNDRIFEKSEWHTRGWTLQELLAPIELNFFECHWNPIGSRSELADKISNATGIDIGYLRGDDFHHVRGDFFQASVAKRMSWLARRQTSRIEDIAYCMLGIFDVNMPVLYGEGKKAFMRLQLEIIKKSDDESIFAWTPSHRHSCNYSLDLSEERKPCMGMLALWPEDFADSGDIWIDPLGKRCEERLPYSMTNKGLQFRTLVDWWASSDECEGTVIDLGLNCWRGPQRNPRSITISLEKIGKHWARIEMSQWRERQHVHSTVRRTGTMPFGAAPKTVTLYVQQGGM
jgi:Heterokaryon incompatibility protein (HET)